MLTTFPSLRFQGATSSASVASRPIVRTRNFPEGESVSKMLELIPPDGILLLGTARSLDGLRLPPGQSLQLSARLTSKQPPVYIPVNGVNAFFNPVEAGWHDTSFSEFQGVFWREKGQIFYSDGIQQPCKPSNKPVYLQQSGTSDFIRIEHGKVYALSPGDTLYVGSKRPGGGIQIHI